MTIITPAEAANTLRCETSDPYMLQLLAQVDDYIQAATGRAWQDDSPIAQRAKSAAQMLLVMWYETPAMLQDDKIPPFGLSAVLTQLEAHALKYRSTQFDGINGGGAIAIRGARIGDRVTALIGITGVSGDQSANFESVLTLDGFIRQTSGADLSSNQYLVTLISARDAAT